MRVNPPPGTETDGDLRTINSGVLEVFQLGEWMIVRPNEFEVHTVATRHIQKLIHNALAIATTVDGVKAGQYVVVGDTVHAAGHAQVEHALCKAISDLRHAADELDAERLSCFGWRQV